MHKNIEKLINLALIGAISANNAIVLAEGLESTEIVESTENTQTEEPNLISMSTNEETPLTSELNIESIVEDDTVREGTLEITLNEGENIPDLTSLDKSYSTLVIKTLGNKELDLKDYSQIKYSNIPNIDLSDAFCELIPNGALSNSSSLQTFIFPKGLIKIGEGSYVDQYGPFQNCVNLTKISSFPDTLQIINSSSFEGCSSLEGNLIIPNSVKKLADGAFKDCSSLTGNLILPSSVTEIGGRTFYNCSGFTGKLVIPESITFINDYAFYGCSGFTGDLILHDKITGIGYSAFQKCSGFNGRLVIPNSVTQMRSSAFRECSGFTGDLIIPNSLTTIGVRTFDGCSGFNGKLVIPDSITKIELCAFTECSGLTGDLTIPDSVTFLDNSAFSKCSGLNGKLTISSNLTTIPYGTFDGCSNLTGNLNIPSSVTKIDSLAFKDCSGLTGKLNIPQNVTLIGSSAFENCTGLTGNLFIPNLVTTIGRGAFENCTGFTGDLIIPNTVTDVGGYAFKGCTGFTGDLIISKNLTKLNDFTFNGCSGLTGKLTIPESVTYIGSFAFNGCSGLEGELVIPHAVTAIGGSAFGGCSGFSGDLTLSSNIKSIGGYAFYGATNLKKIISIPASTEDISKYYLPNNMPDMINAAFTITNNDYASNYGKDVFDYLFTWNKKVYIETPYGFKIEDTWIKDYSNIVKSPTFSILDDSILDNPDNEIYTSEAIITIPTPYKENEIVVTKDDIPYTLPSKNNNSSYTFKEPGKYSVVLTTESGVVSTFDFEVISFYGSTKINYFDKETDEVLETETIKDLKVGEHTYKPKEINGYDLNDISFKTVTINRANRNHVISFKYLKTIKGLVNIKYIDDVTEEEIIPSEAFNNLDLGNHTYSAKDIEGYDLISEGSDSFELTRENPNKTIEFRYSKIENGSVTIKYIDDTTGEELIPSKISNKLTLGNYNYNATLIENYKLIGDSTVSVDIDKDNLDKVIEFKYSKITDSDEESPEENKYLITAKYIDDDTDEELLPEVTYKNLSVGIYNCDFKNIDGYTLIGDSNVSIEVTDDNPTKIVEFRYQKTIKGSVTIKYLDSETGLELLPTEITNDLDLGTHTYNPKDIEDYELVSDTSASIELTRDNPNKTIEFKYQKIIKGSVTIKYLDSETGLELLPTETINDLGLGSHIYKSKDIKDYELVSDISVSIELTRDNPNKTIEFKYQKTIKGSVTIKYLDSETGLELFPTEIINDLNLEAHVYKSKEVDGYSLIGDNTISVELTRNNPNKIIEFRYSKNIEDVKDDELVATKDDILDAINKNSDLSIVGSTGILKIYNSTLVKIKDLVENVVLTIQDKTIIDSSILKLIKSEGLNVVDSFTAYVNLSDLQDDYHLNLGRSINDHNGQKLYLYRLSENSRNVSLQYIGEYDVVTGIASFDINSKSLNNADFILTNNKRDIDTNTNDTTNNPNDNNNNNNSNNNSNNNNNNNNNKPNNNISGNGTSDNSDLIPNLSGLNKIISSLSIASILSGLYISIKKKKNK